MSRPVSQWMARPVSQCLSQSVSECLGQSVSEWLGQSVSQCRSQPVSQCLGQSVFGQSFRSAIGLWMLNVSIRPATTFLTNPSPTDINCPIRRSNGNPRRLRRIHISSITVSSKQQPRALFREAEPSKFFCWMSTKDTRKQSINDWFQSSDPHTHLLCVTVQCMSNPTEQEVIRVHYSVSVTKLIQPICSCRTS